MSDAPAAPAAPAAAPAQPANGAAGAHTPAPTGPGAPRHPDGRFAPKDGAVGAVPQERPAEKPPAPAAKPDDFVYEDELVVRGEKAKVRLSREELRRELQVKKDLERRRKEADEALKREARLKQLGLTDPVAALRELGASDEQIEQWALQQAIERAKLETMDEGERRLYELQQENQRLKEQWEQTQKQQEESQRTAQREQLKQQNLQEFREALEVAKLPKNHETLYLLAETQELALRAGEPRMDPKTLAAAAEKRLLRQTQTILSGLDGDALVDRLGEETCLRIGQALVKRFQSAQSFEPPPSEPAYRAPAKEERQYIDEAEAERRLRALKASLK